MRNILQRILKKYTPGFELNSNMKFEVTTAEIAKITFLCDVTLCSLVDCYQFQKVVILVWSLLNHTGFQCSCVHGN